MSQLAAQPKTPPDVQRMLCEHCGAGILLQRPTEQVQCGHCHQHSRVPSPLLHALRQAWAQQSLDDAQASGLRKMEATLASMPETMVSPMLMVAGLATGSTVLMLIQAPLLTAKMVVGMLGVPVAFIAGACVVLLARRAHKQERLRTMKQVTPLLQGGIACPECGAALVVPPDAPVVACGYCNATSLLPRELVAPHAAQLQEQLAKAYEEARRSTGTALRRMQIGFFMICGSALVVSLVSFLI